MNYNLNELSAKQEKRSSYAALKSLLQLIAHERKNLLLALCAILLNAAFNLTGPLLIGRAIDQYVQHKQFNGVLMYGGILLTMYILALGSSYFQTQLMGGVGQRMLFTLRNRIFGKLQQLPVAFFNTNKAGDLISRVNNDTDKLNSFFSQSLMQFIGSIAIMAGAGIFLLSINIRLGAVALLPGLLILIFTRLVSPWIKKKNAASLKSTGSLSAEIQESLNNFKVIIAFNRRDYFRKKFNEANEDNYRNALSSGLANNILLPVYGLFSGLAQLLVLVYGIYLIHSGLFSIGLLVSYFAYITNFYNPLRQLSQLWTSYQMAMAGWDRVGEILGMETNLVQSKDKAPVKDPSGALITFKNVHFGYPGGKEILHNISLELKKGKTYAFIGPTGGGKTTTASLIARLYDPLSGEVLLYDRDIRSYSPAALAQKVGFILQEPFLFSGTIRENLIYGNPDYAAYSNEQLETVIREHNLEALLALFEKGLDTEVTQRGNSISLGQKQLVAFMRAVLRNPEVLILDEATANIDTVTEHLLDNILEKLPATTTRVIIAHRLNTIRNADEIYFVNSGEVMRAGSFDEAMDKLLHGQKNS